MADGGLPALGVSPPVELEDPPEGHYSHDEGSGGGAGFGRSEGGGASDRRQFYRSNSMFCESSSRNFSGRGGDGGGGSDTLDSSGGGGGGGGDGSAVRPKRVPSKFGRRSTRKSSKVDQDDIGGDEQMAFWSGSELAHGGGGDSGRQQPSPASAAAKARRDRSAPPSGRTHHPAGIGGYPQFSGQAEGGPGPLDGSGSGSATVMAAATARGVRGTDGAGDAAAADSTLGTQGVAADPGVGVGGDGDGDAVNPRRRTGEGRRVVDGYTSAPEVCSDIVARGAALEVEECIARAEAALFAIDTTSESEAKGAASAKAREREQRSVSMSVSMSSDGDGDEERSFSSSLGAGNGAVNGNGNGNGTAAPGNSSRAISAPTAVAAAGAAGAGGKQATTSKRRRFAELLSFRRRGSSSGGGGPPPLPPISAGGSGTGATDDNGILQHGSSNGSSSGASLRATSGGRTAPRRGSVSSSAHSAQHPRRHMLRRANSTSALDSLGNDRQEDEEEEEEEEEEEDENEEEEEDFSATATAAAAVTVTASGKSAARRRGGRGGTRRRLLPGGSSSASATSAAAAGAAAERGMSASPGRHRHRRHRDSFLEAGKDKLRRGRSKLSRGAFGGRSASQRRLRAVLPADGASRDGSASPGVLNGGRVVEGREEETDGSGRAAPRQVKQGPPAKPQLGTTYTKRPTPAAGEPDPGGAPWNTWGLGSASDFSVRTKGYGRTKVKAPSAPQLYELVSIDAYKSPAGRICGVYPMFDPPACLAGSASSPSPRTSVNGGQRPATEEAAGAAAAATNGGAGNGHGSEKEVPGSTAAQAGGGGGTGHPDIPPVLVVNCQLPDIPTPFAGQGDGPTVHIIFTFRATPRLCRYAARVWADEAAAAAASGGSSSGDGERMGSPSGTPPAAKGVAAAGDAVAGAGEGDGAASGDSMAGSGGQAVAGGEQGDGDVPESVRLLVEWMRRAEDDGNFRGRFKAIGDIVNADEVGLPSIARRFSGKPILLYGKESSMVRGPGFAELDLNAHAFSYVGRKGLYVTLDKWKGAIFRIGFLLEGRSDEEQPEHILGCGVFHGLDIYSLNELAASADGKRLVVTNPAAVANQDGVGAGRGAAAAAAGSPAAYANSSSSGSPSSFSASAARGGPPQGLLGGQNARGGVAVSPRSTSSSVVPLVPRRHMTQLLHSLGIEAGGYEIGGSGGEGAVASAAARAEKAFFGDGSLELRDGDGNDVTLTAVAAAAFAGGWFCALLAVVTMACWSELSTGGEGEGGLWPAGIGAWMVRVFADP